MKSFAILALATLVLASCARYEANDLRAVHISGLASHPGSSDAKDSVGRALFVKNCAHCHGAGAHGDEGPDLHNLDGTDEQIGNRIRNGKKGQMTAFAGKLSAQQISDVVEYLRTLK